MWLPAKESFHDYAIAKLAIMNRLKLSTKEKIHLLIGGITLSAVKSAALTLPDHSINQFLVKMRCMAKGAAEQEKKTNMPASSQKLKEKSCRNCGKKGHIRTAARSPAVSTAKNKDISSSTARC